jgi:hypothetical protein
MSDTGAFLPRLSEAIQHQHEATAQLQQLATELIDHVARMRSWTDKLQAHLVAPETPARVRQDVVVPETPAMSFANLGSLGNEPLVLPRVLQGGPARER